MSHSASTIERIRGYYMGEDVLLSDQELALLARWEEAFTFLRESKSVTETVTLLSRRFPSCSKRILYRDVQSAIQLFGDVVKYSKEAMRNMANEFALDFLNRCRKTGDRTNEKNALALLIKINKLDKDEHMLDEQLMVSHEPVVIQIPEHVSGMLHALLGQGSINLMQLREKAIPVSHYDTTEPELQPAPADPGPGASA